MNILNVVFSVICDRILVNKPYDSSVPNLVRDNSFSKTAICSCKPDTKDPCGPTSDCENRSLQIECSVSLEIHINQTEDTNQTFKIRG